MTDHCHFLLKVKAPGKISNVMRTYKMGLTFQIGIGAFWQPRFYQQFPEDPEAEFPLEIEPKLTKMQIKHRKQCRKMHTTQVVLGGTQVLYKTTQVVKKCKQRRSKTCSVV